MGRRRRRWKLRRQRRRHGVPRPNIDRARDRVAPAWTIRAPRRPAAGCSTDAVDDRKDVTAMAARMPSWIFRRRPAMEQQSTSDNRPPQMRQRQGGGACPSKRCTGWMGRHVFATAFADGFEFEPIRHAGMSARRSTDAEPSSRLLVGNPESGGAARTASGGIGARPLAHHPGRYVDGERAGCGARRLQASRRAASPSRSRQSARAARCHHPHDPCRHRDVVEGGASRRTLHRRDRPLVHADVVSASTTSRRA